MVRAVQRVYGCRDECGNAGQGNLTIAIALEVGRFLTADTLVWEGPTVPPRRAPRGTW
jgi:hypothetical protein